MRGVVLLGVTIPEVINEKVNRLREDFDRHAEDNDREFSDNRDAARPHAAEVGGFNLVWGGEHWPSATFTKT